MSAFQLVCHQYLNAYSSNAEIQVVMLRINFFLILYCIKNWLICQIGLLFYWGVIYFFFVSINRKCMNFTLCTSFHCHSSLWSVISDSRAIETTFKRNWTTPSRQAWRSCRSRWSKERNRVKWKEASTLERDIYM